MKTTRPLFNLVSGGMYAEWKEAEPQLQQSGAREGNPGRAFRFGRAIAGEAE